MKFDWHESMMEVLVHSLLGSEVSVFLADMVVVKFPF